MKTTEIINLTASIFEYEKMNGNLKRAFLDCEKFKNQNKEFELVTEIQRKKDETRIDFANRVAEITNISYKEARALEVSSIDCYKAIEKKQGKNLTNSDCITIAERSAAAKPIKKNAYKCFLESVRNMTEEEFEAIWTK